MHPLLAASDSSSSASASASVIAGEAALEESVVSLHRVFVAWGDPAPSFVVYLRPVFLALLEMHCQVHAAFYDREFVEMFFIPFRTHSPTK